MDNTIISVHISVYFNVAIIMSIYTFLLLNHPYWTLHTGYVKTVFSPNWLKANKHITKIAELLYHVLHKLIGVYFLFWPFEAGGA